MNYSHLYSKNWRFIRIIDIIQNRFNPLFMEVSVFIAQILGVVYVVIGLGLLINQDYYMKMYKEMVKSSSYIFLAAALALILGIVLVLIHNFWVGSWEVIITIFAWISLVKGVLLLLFPASMMKLNMSLVSRGMLVAGGLFSLILGIVLGYFGYFV